MIYCFDTYYDDRHANTAVLGIENWDSSAPEFELTQITTEVNDYESGSFYKRELPCLMSAIEQINLNPSRDIFVIDGYVILSDEGKLGLGGYLFHELEGKIPVIGIAKNNFLSLNKGQKEVYRGMSKKPLYITALGFDLQDASNHVLQMHGKNRIPTILKLVDQKSRIITNHS